jgi:hypothetical protein
MVRDLATSLFLSTNIVQLNHHYTLAELNDIGYQEIVMGDAAYTTIMSFLRDRYGVSELMCTKCTQLYDLCTISLRLPLMQATKDYATVRNSINKFLQSGVLPTSTVATGWCHEAWCLVSRSQGRATREVRRLVFVPPVEGEAVTFPGNKPFFHPLTVASETSFYANLTFRSPFDGWSEDEKALFNAALSPGSTSTRPSVQIGTHVMAWLYQHRGINGITFEEDLQKFGEVSAMDVWLQQVHHTFDLADHANLLFSSL